MQKTKTMREGQTSAGPARRWRWLVVLGLLLVAALLLRPGIGQGMLTLAEHSLRLGDVSSARLWTARSETWSGKQSAQLLMLAAISRTKGDLPQAADLIDQAEQAGARNPVVERERRLLQLSMGRAGDLQDIEAVLGQVDVQLTDAFDAILMGVIAKDQQELAEQLIQQWKDLDPKDPNAYYWSAHLAEIRGEQALARSELQKAIAISPFHQRARLALAHMDEREDRLTPAYEQFQQLRSRDGLVEAQIEMARILRRMGHYQQATEVLGELDSAAARQERARLAFEQADYERAIELFRSAPDEDNDEMLATALHLAGRDAAARQLLEEVASRNQEKHRQQELKTRPEVE